MAALKDKEPLTRHNILLPPGMFKEIGDLHGMSSSEVIRIVMADHMRKKRLAVKQQDGSLNIAIKLKEGQDDE